MKKKYKLVLSLCIQDRKLLAKNYDLLENISVPLCDTIMGS